MLTAVILLIVLIFLNAVFACAEIAVLSCNASKLKKMSSEGDKRAKKLLSLTDNPAKFLATIQVAITLAGLLQSAFAAENFAEPLVDFVILIGINASAEVLKPVAIVIITLILSYFTLVFGELVPKRLAMKKAEGMALGMSGLLYGVAKIFAPIVWLLTVSTNIVIRIFGMNPHENEEIVTEEEIRMMLDEGSEQGTIREEETQIIQNVFEFNDTEASEICTRRREIVGLYLKDEAGSWTQIIDQNRHTFYPIYDKSIDDIIGLLDSRDYFRLSDKSRDNLMKNAVTQPLFVPENLRANILFKRMKESHKYFAVLIDEYGSLSGIVTLHDLIESLVGDINETEEEDKEVDITKTGDNTWLIVGTASLEEVAQELEAELPTDDFDTFGGYIFDVLGRVLDCGEEFECETDQLIISGKVIENHLVGLTTVAKKEKSHNENE